MTGETTREFIRVWGVVPAVVKAIGMILSVCISVVGVLYVYDDQRNKEIQELRDADRDQAYENKTKDRINELQDKQIEQLRIKVDAMKEVQNELVYTVRQHQSARGGHN